MKRLRDLVGRELKWVQPRAGDRDFELIDSDEVVATLRFRSMFGSLATAETADGTWTFKRVGFWQTRVTVHATGTDLEIASFKNNTWSGGGTLELADGRRFPANTNFWNSKYEFQTADGEPLVRYRQIGGVLHSSSWCEIPAAAASLAELPWLVALGWYLAIKMRDDSAAAAAVAGAGA